MERLLDEQTVTIASDNPYWTLAPAVSTTRELAFLRVVASECVHLALRQPTMDANHNTLGDS